MNSVKLKWRLALCAFFLPASAVAQNYPDRPITIMVPFTPGGVTDTSGRLIADQLGGAPADWRFIGEHLAKWLG